MKGCAFFAALFLLGVGLVIGGFVYEVMYAGLQYQDPTPALRRDYSHNAGIARILEVSGVVVAFGAIFGATGWAFSRRGREDREDSKDDALR